MITAKHNKLKLDGLGTGDKEANKAQKKKNTKAKATVQDWLEVQDETKKERLERGKSSKA